MDLSLALDVIGSGQRRRADLDLHRLVGTRCTNCSVPSWPGRAICHQCGSADLVAETFSATGTLITHTTVHVPLPGLPAPYMLGQVQLDDNGPLVFGQLRALPSDVAVPSAVSTVLGDPAVTPWYWFEGVS